MTSNVLLLLPADHSSQAAVGEAIAAAKQRGGRLLVAVALDSGLVERVSEALTEDGFIGEKISDQVSATLLREYHARAGALAAEIGALARSEGVETEHVFEQGDPAEICRRLIPLHAIGLAVLVAERRSWLTRLLSRHALKTPALADCEVRVFEEDGD